MEPTYEDVVRARDKMAGSGPVRKTPLERSSTFSDMAGSEVYLKHEYQQKTGAFKIRGAYYKIKSLPDEAKRLGVVAASAGNHAQGVAVAAASEGIPCTIVMPKSASPAKVAATKGYGATVILDGGSYDESWERAKELAKKTGATIIHAFDDPEIIAAQGVIGLEILDDLPDVDEVYVPVGGGGLAAGIAIAVKEKRPQARIIGVQSESFSSMKQSLAAGKIVPVSGRPTIADGVSVSRPGEMTAAILRRLADRIVTVPDEAIVEAMFLLMERAKAVVEPAGAIALACVLASPPAPETKAVAVLAGGNVDMYLLGQIVDKGLARTGRLTRVFVLLPDRPGMFKAVVDAVTDSNANIVEVVHDRFSSSVSAGSAGVTLSLETQDGKDAESLFARFREMGISFEHLT